MRTSLKLIFSALGLSMALTSCTFHEDPFVVEGEGLWNITSKQTVIYENGTQVLDETRTDSLGQWEFLRTGRGFLREASGAVDTVVWDESLEDSRLIIYRKVGSWINAAITERTDNSMNLSWVIEGDEWQVHRRSEFRATIQRAQ